MKTSAALILLLLTLLWLPVQAQAAPPKIIVFDQAHGQQFQIDKTGKLDLSKLGAVFRQQNWRVQTNTQPITAAVLAHADALVISGPFKAITTAEIDAILRFVRGGGTLCVMLHIGPPASDLLHALNVTISNGVIRELENVIQEDSLNFEVISLPKHPLTQGLKRFSVFGGWALLNEGHAKTVARTGSKAWVDLNYDGKYTAGDAVQSFDVVLAGKEGKGRFVVFGDDAIFQNQFFQKNNLTLGKNLVRWLGAK